jgi:hypothetical protein
MPVAGISKVVDIQVDCGVGPSRTADMPAKGAYPPERSSRRQSAPSGRLQSRCHKARGRDRFSAALSNETASGGRAPSLSIARVANRTAGRRRDDPRGRRSRGSPCPPAWSDSIKRCTARPADRIPRPRPRRRGVRTPTDSAYGSSHVLLRGSGVRAGPAAGKFSPHKCAV